MKQFCFILIPKVRHNPRANIDTFTDIKRHCLTCTMKIYTPGREGRAASSFFRCSGYLYISSSNIDTYCLLSARDGLAQEWPLEKVVNRRLISTADA